MSRRMNQTYSEWYEFDVNVVLTCTNESEYLNFSTVDSLILKIL